jgi:hypothetical protein
MMLRFFGSTLKEFWTSILAGHQLIHRTHIEKPTPALAGGGEVVGTRVGIAPDLMS